MSGRIVAPSLLLSVVITLSSQQAKPAVPQQKADDSAAIVQPGPPGQSSKLLSPAAVVPLLRRTPVEADVSFMQGMIMHHAQAVEMTDLLYAKLPSSPAGIG
jgi:uncharacterized protein (DUF305 family)